MRSMSPRPGMAPTRFSVPAAASPAAPAAPERTIVRRLTRRLSSRSSIGVVPAHSAGHAGSCFCSFAVITGNLVGTLA